MFYSIELLNRKAALGLVWLAGTKGRRLTKLNVLETDVEEACNIILNPPVVLALRLQSTLLLGTVVILNRQADYLADDVDKILKKIQYAQDSFQSNSDHCASFSAITLPECEGETSDIQYEQIPEKPDMRSVPFPLELLTPKECPSPTAARPDDLLLPEMNLSSFEQFDANQDISFQGALGDLGGEEENQNQPLSFDHFQQLEESNGDSSMMREELEKRCEEEQNQGDNLKRERGDDWELLPLARPLKRQKRAVIDKKLALTDSDLRSWFKDTSSITAPPKFRSWEEELKEEMINRGCAAFCLFGITLHPSLMKLYSAPPPQPQNGGDENQFRGVENASTIDEELNAKIFVAEHFGVSMDELFGGEMDFQDNSIHPLRAGEDEETISNIQSIELSQLSGVRSTPQPSPRSALLGDTPQRRSTPQTLRDLEAFSPIRPPAHVEEGDAPASPGGESNRIIESFDTTTFQFLNYLRTSSPLGKGDPFSSISMQSLVDQIAGERGKTPVASRTFYQVLVLASSGFLEVSQARPYGAIALSAGEAL